MKKGFTLIELLLVMAILGTIIMLVISHQRILNYKTIYNGYQKKATEDVLNATNMVLYNFPSLKGFNDISTRYKEITHTDFSTSCSSSSTKCVRDFYKTTIKGNICDSLDNCKAGSDFDGTYDGMVGDLTSPTYGIRLKNGEVIMFGQGTGIDGACDDANTACFVAYVDMNGKKAPNTYGQDRYRFFIYKNHVEHDSSRDVPYVNTNALSKEEQERYDEMEQVWLACSSQVKTGGNSADNCRPFVNTWNGQPFAKSKLTLYNDNTYTKAAGECTYNKESNKATCSSS